MGARSRRRGGGWSMVATKPRRQYIRKKVMPATAGRDTLVPPPALPSAGLGLWKMCCPAWVRWANLLRLSCWRAGASAPQQVPQIPPVMRNSMPAQQPIVPQIPLTMAGLIAGQLLANGAASAPPTSLPALVAPYQPPMQSWQLPTTSADLQVGCVRRAPTLCMLPCCSVCLAIAG